MVISIFKSRKWVFILLGAVLLVGVILRIHLLPVPLERDEGEYAYAGQLILQGIPPYEQVYNMKLPGVYFIYALIIRLLGESPAAIHTGLLIVNLVTILLLFLFTRKLCDEATALAAAATFAILSVNPFVHGVFAHAEHFVVLFVLASLTCLLHTWESESRPVVFLSGLLAGIALLMKQHAVSFAGLALAALLMEVLFKKDRPSWKSSLIPLIFLMGLTMPLLLTCLYFLRVGLWEKFLFWTFFYAREYISITDPLSGLADLKHKINLIFNYAGALWILSAAGALALLSPCIDLKKRLFIVLFIIFSGLAVTPGFYFREHYFIMVLPVVSLLAALSLRSLGAYLGALWPALRVALPALIFILAASSSIFQMQDYLFKMSPLSAIRLTHSLNPFPESLPVAGYLKERSLPTEKIAVLGSEPQIYFYAQRPGATGFIYMYPLMERQRFALTMQEKMIREIESARAKYIVFVHIPTSWLRKEESYDHVFGWFFDYVSRNYKPCGLVEIKDASTSTFYWDQEAVGRKPLSPLWISIYERIS